MAKKPKVPAFKSSGFALLDVTTGRKALEQYTKKAGRVRATLDVVIEYAHGSDDGTSTEFACDVSSIKNVRAL